MAFPAFKIAGNLYYVGTVTLNSFLISTPQGAILINTNFEDTIPLLKTSLEQVGFKWSDVKIILGSHAHPDHMQADGTVKELTGAQVMAMEQDVPALKNMMVANKPHPIDRVLKDGDTVTLGGTTLTALTNLPIDGGAPPPSGAFGVRLVGNTNAPERVTAVKNVAVSGNTLTLTATEHLNRTTEVVNLHAQVSNLVASFFAHCLAVKEPCPAQRALAQNLLAQQHVGCGVLCVYQS